MKNIKDRIETIIYTLLQTSERVIEVARDHTMTRICDRENSPLKLTVDKYLGKKIAEVAGNDNIFAQCDSRVEQCFISGQNDFLVYRTNINNSSTAYSIRILPIHPDKNLLFIVLENLAHYGESEIIQDKWKLALDAAGDGMWDMNLKDNTIFFSDKWKEIFGYNSGEIVTISDWTEKVYPEDLVTAEANANKYLSGASPIYSTEIRYKCKDGTYKWILSRGIIVSKNEEGSPLRFIGTHTDIHKRKLAEEELKISKETFANSFNYSGTGKALLGLGGNWIEVNNIICKLTEYTKEELLKLHYRDITYPDDVDMDVELIKKLLTKEIPSYSVEKRYVSKTRKVVTTLLTVTLVWDNMDNPKYFVCDIVDMTRKKELNNEISRKNIELETTSINLMNTINQLEGLNQIVAHNLRGPAGNIKMISEQDGIFDDKEALTMIHESSISLLNNLDLLLDLSQIKLNKDIQYDDCNFQDIVNDIIKQSQGIIYQKNVDVIFHLRVQNLAYPKIYLESILYNLISNAIKYSKEDTPLKITISTSNINNVIQLSVKDNGLGIDMEKYRDRVFKLNQVFHQGYDSKGIGLFITKTQIEAIGGKIEVTSKLNEGSEFIVTF
ncbi:hypothetical protein CJD36_022450 [Flavipsychrobacter stenotrophus]|uniref:histidine kinase n=1 Tax=Flavipsychrobacter stenotrophus TaxID=2077091 RepID=A0A2S7SQB4_9BACT|nr:PAS domain-containing sensor histidine kinase [Flavipsychrobacter stenotrophus]PQJ08817.1 hypothetical protein CJD36_022450 [Flavipsychrobacter stenotrophus]